MNFLVHWSPLPWPNSNDFAIAKHTLVIVINIVINHQGLDAFREVHHAPKIKKITLCTPGYFYLGSMHHYIHLFRSTQKCSTPTLAVDTKNIFPYVFPWLLTKPQKIVLQFIIYPLKSLSSRSGLLCLFKKREAKEKERRTKPLFLKVSKQERLLL